MSPSSSSPPAPHGKLVDGGQLRFDERSHFSSQDGTVAEVRWNRSRAIRCRVVRHLCPSIFLSGAAQLVPEWCRRALNSNPPPLEDSRREGSWRASTITSNPTTLHSVAPWLPVHTVAPDLLVSQAASGHEGVDEE